ncbi:PLP-dependent cysteine synthase family protein [Cellulosilyticum ruminicola]|uniref:PLP-dependent cysteine synthase family protein n=1 Tax=Cellulosilyticum ruminicola TaxID=425254 RepID=UPI0006D1DC34|nr:PLP-dependent cysteine synthase family protein [Cellulosilyticum ruminicola]
MNKEFGNTIIDYIGKTPLVQLKNVVTEDMADVYVKLEEFNAGGSVKSRVAIEMIKQAQRKGILTPYSGQTLIEPTGGNTGIGLAMAASVLGYKLILVIPDNYSKEKIKMLEAYGVTVYLSDSTTGNDSHIRLVREIKKEHPEYVWLDQLSNMANVDAHYEGTGKEIVSELDQIDCVVAGMGSSGTISGIGKAVKESFPQAEVVVIQPKGCQSLEGISVPHKIQGLSIGMIPPILQRDVIDCAMDMDYEQAHEMMKLLACKEGLLVGISSGANICGALKLAKKLGKGKVVVTVAPDSGRSYLEHF